MNLRCTTALRNRWDSGSLINVVTLKEAIRPARIQKRALNTSTAILPHPHLSWQRSPRGFKSAQPIRTLTKPGITGDGRQ